jgi:hypothetical protein
MIDLSLKKTKVVKDNPYHPDLETQVVWESSNCKIVEDFFGGITNKKVYSVFVNGEFECVGKFPSDFSKSIARQIKDVVLAKYPNETFSQ